MSKYRTLNDVDVNTIAKVVDEIVSDKITQPSTHQIRNDEIDEIDESMRINEVHLFMDGDYLESYPEKESLYERCYRLVRNKGVRHPVYTSIMRVEHILYRMLLDDDHLDKDVRMVYNKTDLKNGILYTTIPHYLSFKYGKRLFVHLYDNVYEITPGRCIGTTEFITFSTDIEWLLMNGKFDWLSDNLSRKNQPIIGNESRSRSIKVENRFNKLLHSFLDDTIKIIKAYRFYPGVSSSEIIPYDSEFETIPNISTEELKSKFIDYLSSLNYDDELSEKILNDVKTMELFKFWECVTKITGTCLYVGMRQYLIKQCNGYIKIYGIQYKEEFIEHEREVEHLERRKEIVRKRKQNRDREIEMDR